LYPGQVSVHGFSDVKKTIDTRLEARGVENVLRRTSGNPGHVMWNAVAASLEEWLFTVYVPPSVNASMA